MIARKINVYMRDSKLWEHCTLECRIAFIKAMRGKKYGGIWQVRDAFCWFITGWRTADIARLNDTVSQVNSEQHASQEVPQNINMPIGEPDDSFV